MSQNAREPSQNIASATDWDSADATACDAESPTKGWHCTRGSHEDPVHIAGTGGRQEVLAIWTNERLVAEKAPGEELWEGATW